MCIGALHLLHRLWEYWNYWWEITGVFSSSGLQINLYSSRSIWEIVASWRHLSSTHWQSRWHKVDHSKIWDAFEKHWLFRAPQSRSSRGYSAVSVSWKSWMTVRVKCKLWIDRWITGIIWHTCLETNEIGHFVFSDSRCWSVLMCCLCHLNITGVQTMGLIHESFLRTNLFLSPTYEDFTKIVAFMNFFLSRIFS